MTHRRAAAPGPRTVAHPRVSSFNAPPLVGIVLALLGVLMVACGSTTLPSNGPLTVTLPSASAGSGPAGSGGPGGGSPEPGATQPAWPGTTVLATIAMGAADGEIQKAGADLQAAVEAQDLKAMWGAADGLAKMIDGLMPNIERLEFYEVTQPAAAIYRKAFPELSAGARQLRDAITSGDANGVVAGSQAIARGLVDYAPVRPIIGALVEQAILQQRLLTR
ncbi:MAG: hypothetical protein ABIZ72_10905 [Candidatus Limnocylindrales bacterium]